VFSPISGRIGKSTVTVGALVTANQSTPLSIVQQIDPMYIDLTQSSADIIKLRQKITEKQINKSDDAQVKIILDDLNQYYDIVGTLKFSDITVDPSTGNISLRAIIANPNQVLLPGLFVRAVIKEGEYKDAILIPQQAITRNKEGGAMVYIVDNQNKAQLIPVEITQAINNKWLINKGLLSGQKVIVEGTIKIHPGVTVKAIDQSISKNLDQNK